MPSIFFIAVSAEAKNFFSTLFTTAGVTGDEIAVDEVVAADLAVDGVVAILRKSNTSSM